MANAYIDVDLGVTYEDTRTTATSGATVTNKVRVGWDDTLTRQELYDVLTTIRDAVLSPDKVAEVA
jgi:hypothetical protein